MSFFHSIKPPFGLFFFPVEDQLFACACPHEVLSIPCFEHGYGWLSGVMPGVTSIRSSWIVTLGIMPGSNRLRRCISGCLIWLSVWRTSFFDNGWINFFLLLIWGEPEKSGDILE